MVCFKSVVVKPYSYPNIHATVNELDWSIPSSQKSTKNNNFKLRHYYFKQVYRQHMNSSEF